MITRDELIKIGRINKPHGIQGEMSFTFTDDIFDRTDCPYIVCRIEGIFVPFFIEEYRFRNDTSVLIKLEDIDSEEKARRLANREVYFPKKYLREEETDEAPADYFIGFHIEDSDHGDLGPVIAIDDTTPNILFVVDHNGKETLVPANEDLITGIDEKKKIIRMDIPEGLLQL